MNDFPVPPVFWELPTSPQIAHQILKLAPQGSEAVPELLEAVRWDPAVTARILATANGTQFGQTWPVLSLHRARLLLDDLTIRLLSLQFRLDSLCSRREAFQPVYEIVWRQSHIQAVTAALLCEEEADHLEVNPFLAGLLFGLPRLALLQSKPEIAGRISETIRQTGRTWSEVEQELAPTDDPERGQLFVEANFPSAFLKAVEPDGAKTRLAAVLQVAEAMGDFLSLKEANPSLAQRWRDRLAERHESFHRAGHGSPMALESLVDSVRERLEEWCPWNEDLPADTELLYEANRELGRLGLQTAEEFSETQNRAQLAEQTIQLHERQILTLERQALRDPLTGIYNRRFLIEALQKEVARCCRYAVPIGLLFLDVDAFKPLNDTWGHLVGDVVLRRIAETLESVLRGADVLARYGGEEFIVLPNDPDEAGIVQLAERLRRAVEQMVTKVEGQSVGVTISVGCAITVPTRNDLDLAAQLLASADAAMYDAKQLGRNRVVFRSLLEETERDLMQLTIDRSFSRWLVTRNLVSPQDLEDILLDYSPERLPLGELAVQSGLLTDDQVAELLDLQERHHDRFGILALKRNMLSVDQLAMLLARQRENPLQLARLLAARHLLEEAEALELVDKYLVNLK